MKIRIVNIISILNSYFKFFNFFLQARLMLHNISIFSSDPTHALVLLILVALLQHSIGCFTTCVRYALLVASVYLFEAYTREVGLR